MKEVLILTFSCILFWAILWFPVKAIVWAVHTFEMKLKDKKKPDNKDT